MPKVFVTYHPDTYDEFFAEPLKAFPTLTQDLMSDFLMYKGTGQLPRYFGRDVPYTQPHAAFRAQLMHIHLRLPPSLFPDRYCIFGVFYPDAHAKAREEKTMRYLARLAQRFRDEH